MQASSNRLSGRVIRRALASGIFAAAGVITPIGAQAAFPIIGYWPNWGGSTADIQYQYLTQINYSFGSVDGNGTIGGVNDAQIRDLIARGHAGNVKIAVALGGGGGDKGFSALTNSATATDNFIKNASALCDKYNLDGIDIDWEYTPGSQAAAFEAWMKKLGDALHAKGRLLSIAVIGGDPGVGKDIRNGVFDAVDYVNVMAYDNPEANHSTYDLAAMCMSYWTKTHGCPKAKTILGVPFYGRDPSGNSSVSYKDLVAKDAGAPQKDLVGNVGYNGIPTLQKKTQLAFDQGAGIMIWEISLDTHDNTSLLKAIHDKAAAFLNVDVRVAADRGQPILSWSHGRLRLAPGKPGRYRVGLHSVSGQLIAEQSVELSAEAATLGFWDSRSVAPGVYSATVSGAGIFSAQRVNLPIAP